jgi:hypothetical protein
MSLHCRTLIESYLGAYLLVFACLVSGMDDCYAQWQIGLCASGKGVFNVTTSPVANAQTVLNSVPDVSLIGRVALDTAAVARLEGELGFSAYSARSVSSFGGPSTNAFRMSARLQALSAAAMLNLYDVVSVGFAALVPLSGSYTSNVEVFDSGRQFGTDQEFAFTRENLRSPIEARIRATLLQFSLGKGALVIYASGAYSLSALVLPTNNPQRLYTPGTNIVGQDPLAGLRTYSIQPLSFLLGVAYFLNL